MSRRVHVFPAWEQNPYLNMLYVSARAEGWYVDGSKTVPALARVIPQLAEGDVLHVHWTSPVLHHSETPAQAKNALLEFERMLADIKRAGARLIWTVHNTLAHDARYPDLEIQLARVLAREADCIIQLNRFTREAVAKYYDLPPRKLVTLRHASYFGVYGPPPSQYTARQELGIPAAARVVGFVGQMRAYKGITTLLRAVAQVERKNLTLVLAGKTSSEDRAQIERELPAGVPSVRNHAFINDADLGSWFSACDVLVFPYERVLNSGSVLLSATFGRPCILPAEPHLLAEYGDQEWVSFYETGEDKVGALAKMLPIALSKAESAQQSAREFATEYTTLQMARDYVAILEDVLSERMATRREVR